MVKRLRQATNDYAPPPSPPLPPTMALLGGRSWPQTAGKQEGNDVKTRAAIEVYRFLARM